MSFPQGMVHFPGIESILGFDMVRGHGISPQPITITITPQQDIPYRQGDLLLRYGNFSLRIRDCIIDQAQFRFDQNGNIWQLTLLDRRWKWDKLREENGGISARYNTRLAHGPVEIMDPKTKRSARQIMDDCLRKMGERRYRYVGQIPELYPQIDWDRENPARALAQVAELCGARVVYRLDDTILITRTGRDIYGRPPALPNGPIIFENAGVNPPETPSEIHLVCGPTRFQGDFFLEPVGDDIDGLLVPINELTYKPKPDGWEYGDEIEWLDVPLFQGAPSLWKSLQRPRELARGSVFKKYRVKVTNQSKRNSFIIPGYKGERIKSIDQVLPIGAQLIEPVFDKDTGWLKPIETMIWGCFAYGAENNITLEDVAAGQADRRKFDWDTKPKIVIPEINATTGEPMPDKNTTLIPPDEYSIDPETGVVEFSSMKFRYATDDVPAGDARLCKKPALLWLRCGLTLNDAKTRQPIRHVEKIKIIGAPAGAGILEIRDETLFVRVVPKYSPGHPETIAGTKDNLKTVQAEARRRLQAEAAKFQQLGPSQRTYAGWAYHDIDGAIHQAHYSISMEGKATMGLCLNDELTILTMPYQERRFYEKMATYDTDLKTVRLLQGTFRYPFSKISNISRRG